MMSGEGEHRKLNQEIVQRLNWIISLINCLITAKLFKSGLVNVISVKLKRSTNIK
jgi:hypothetical protein